ncbi:MAG: ABC transporter substrate-binding protein [Pseudolabrys sp.]|nr:ABC transporter substrate-binding protein [Pseudolabrys sp.]
MRRGILFVALAILALVIHAGPAAAQSAPIKIKFAEGSRNFNVLPAYIAIQNGYFAQEGIEPELITLKGGPAAANALVGGDVDIAFTLTESVIKLKQQGKDLTVAAVIQDKNPCVLVVTTGNPAKGLADLKGQTIGVTATGSLTDLVLRQYMKQQGLSASDYKIVAFGTPATVNLALERGEIPAAVTITPFLTRLQINKTARVLVDFRNDFYPGQSMLVRTADLKGDKKVIFQKVMRALQKGMDTLYGDEAATAKAAKAFFPTMEPDLLEASLKDDIKVHAMFAHKLTVTRADFEKWQNTLIENKLLSAPESHDTVFAKW